MIYTEQQLIGKIRKMIDEYVEKNKERCIAFISLGQVRYLSVLQFCKAIVGNSSSGIVEVPSFHIPTVNIGNRQKGRIAAESVIHCGYEIKEIDRALGHALSDELTEKISKCKNPYEKDNTAMNIYNIIKKYANERNCISKKFYDLI